MRVTNEEQPFHPIYNYAFITDSAEGLIVTDVNTLANFEPRDNFLERALTWNEGGILNGARHITIAGYYLLHRADAGIVVLDMDDPMAPRVLGVIDLPDARATALQFRYLFVTTSRGLEIVDVTHPERPRCGRRCGGAAGRRASGLCGPHLRLCRRRLGRARHRIDVERPEQPSLLMTFTADGQINDARDVIVGTTNATLFAYIADGVNGLKVVQLTSPDLQPNFYGFSPEPNPELIAWKRTEWPAMSVSKGLDRDRAVDETGGQMAIFGRLGSRPFNYEEQRRFYLDANGNPWFVTDEVRDEDRRDRTEQAEVK